MKPGGFQQHLPAGQRSAYPHQQLKSSPPFPIPSNQHLQASSPQILQHSSPQVDQQNLLPSTKAGTPLQSANSPFVVPSPSTPLAPSPMPGDSEKPVSGVSSLSNAGNAGQQQTSAVVASAQSLAIGTPGISASPLLAEFSGYEGTHANNLTSVSGKSSITEQPLDRLIKAVSYDEIFHFDLFRAQCSFHEKTVLKSLYLCFFFSSFSIVPSVLLVNDM